MTKEELARQYSDGVMVQKRKNGLTITVSPSIKDAFIAGYEALEKENAELEAQIEKMKCCEICGHHKWGSCNYHSLWVNDCKKNGMKHFELKE